MMSKNSQRAALALASLVTLGGCDFVGNVFLNPNNDPLTREGLWNPYDHANRANLVAEVANPADLTRGVAASDSLGQLAAAAVDRLYSDKVKTISTTSSKSE